MTKKNSAAVALGRLGGLAKSPAKTAANKAKAMKRWANRPKDKTRKKKKDSRC